MDYCFDSKNAIEKICTSMKEYFNANHLPGKCVIGISGGKDSYVVAALACKVFGRENVLGVMMPNGKQSDIDDSKRVVENLGIKSMTVNIADCYKTLGEALTIGYQSAFDITDINAVISGLKNNKLYTTNTPSRIRMVTLFGIAAIENAVVLNTDNASELYLGYSTIFGDLAGSYAPIKPYTVTEVLSIGDELGLIKELVHKAPGDGMCGSTDEENLGRILGITAFTYARVDKMIRNEEDDFTTEEREKILAYHKKNEFKLSLINVPCGER